MAKPTAAYLITAEQQSALAWLNKQVALGKLSRPDIQAAVGLSQANVWQILSGRRVMASTGVRALVLYADKLRGRMPRPFDLDPFDQLRRISKEATPKDRSAIIQVVTALVQVYSKPRRRR